jgi:predicted GNAT superfamily acetyltransferase
MSDSTKRNMDAIVKAVADSPRRDNSVYHQAMADARQAFADAEAALGVPVKMKTKARLKKDGSYVVKWTFKPDN